MFIGLGNLNANICIFIENRPPLEQYQQLNHMLRLQHGDIEFIAKQTGNHWRKIFNVYAKLLYEYSNKGYSSWQQLRDEYLLQDNSDECLFFTQPHLPCNGDLKTRQRIHIIMGKTYATKLGLSTKCHWINKDFAINKAQRIIICPYFDYRQLSNVKISQLVDLISSFRD